MLSSQIRILNFDDTVAQQSTLVERYRPAITDLRSLGPAVRLWSNRNNAEKIRACFQPELRNAVTFLGSGDFHHISSLLIEQFKEPLTVIVFDHHPDWDILPPRLGCGSWVSQTLRCPNVKKVVLLGISSDDISSYSIQTGNLDALANNRVEIYPYRHEPTYTLFKQVPLDNISVQVRRGMPRCRIGWQELWNMDLTEFFFGLLDRLETKNVYVSLDKDCLQAHWSRTNWEEGLFRLPEVQLLIKLIVENLEVLGFDIVGDYSIPRMDGILKTFFSRLDHPRKYSASQQTASEIQETNESLNLQILECLALQH